MTVSGQVGDATAPVNNVFDLRHVASAAVLDSLPRETRERVMVFTSSSLSIHAHIPVKVRAKVQGNLWMCRQYCLKLSSVDIISRWVCSQNGKMLHQLYVLDLRPSQEYGVLHSGDGVG